MPTKHDYSRAIHMYEKEFMSCKEIGDEFGVSKVTIHAYLRSQGVNTSYSRRVIDSQCEKCGNKFQIHRSAKATQEHDFCSTDCYHTWSKSPEFQYRRAQIIRARKVFEDTIGFSYDYILDLIDGNPENIDIKNLIAFRTKKDQMRWKRGGIVQALLGKSQMWEEVEK